MPRRDADVERYEALKRAVAQVGLIRRGSLLRRFMPCGKAGCRCQAKPPKLHGPYYQWTRKLGGKTVTVRMSRPEARLLEQWIKNGRRLEKIASDMERVSYRLTEKMLRASRRPERLAAAATRRRAPRHSAGRSQPEPGAK